MDRESVDEKAGVAARPADIRAMNAVSVLQLVRSHGAMSRVEIARLSGMSKPTVGLALDSLLEFGLVEQVGRRTGTPGPAALLFKIVATRGYVLAIDVGRYFLRYAIADLEGAIVTQKAYHAQATTAESEVDELIVNSGVLLDAAGLSLADITQVVIGSPGVYGDETQSLYLAGDRAGWEGPDVVSRLRSHFGDHLMIENDINASAIAELDRGHGRDIDDFAFISIGTGVGMGLILNGQLRRGARGAAGEIGYLPISAGGGFDMNDSRARGMLEASASGPAIVRAAERGSLQGISTAEDVFRRAASGDHLAKDLVGAEAEIIARAAAAISTTIDPHAIVLGGGIGMAAGFAELVEKRVSELIPFPPAILRSALGPDAVLDGAVVMGVSRAWEKLSTHLVATIKGH